MANSGVFTGSVQDGNTKTNYELTYTVTNAEVVFAARCTRAYHRAFFSQSEHAYIFYGCSNEFMTLSVDGQSTEGLRCVRAYPYGTRASDSGWIGDVPPSEVLSLTLPLRGGYYRVQLVFSGNGGQTVTESLLIAGASTLTLSGSRELASPQMLTLTPAAPGLLHSILFETVESSGVIAEATEATELLWTPPCALCAAVTTSRRVPITFTVQTYSGTELVGTSTREETLLVPDNDETLPELSVRCTPINDGLPAAFAGLFIASRSRVRTDFTVSTKLGAVPARYASSVNGAWSEGNPALSALLSESGNVEVTAVAEDSRGLQRTVRQSITVLPYTPPGVVPYSGENAIRCERCAADGTPTSTGTNLRLRCGRQFSDLGGVNAASLEGRIKRREDAHYGAWTTLLSSGAAGSLDTVLMNALPDTHAAYDVELRCCDLLGELGTQHLIVPTDETPLHLARGGVAVGLGRYADLSHGRSVQIGWPVYFDQTVYLGEHELGEWLYPVGSLCRSTDDRFDPAERYGGTWTYRGETFGVHEWNRTA